MRTAANSTEHTLFAALDNRFLDQPALIQCVVVMTAGVLTADIASSLVAAPQPRPNLKCCHRSDCVVVAGIIVERCYFRDKNPATRRSYDVCCEVVQHSDYIKQFDNILSGWRAVCERHYNDRMGQQPESASGWTNND